MKILASILLFSIYIPTLFSAEIIGLDSINLGDKIEILNLKKSVYTGEIDTNIIYLRLFENPNADKPNMLVKGLEYANNYVYIIKDSMYIYSDSTMEYIKNKTNIFEFDNEFTVFDYYLIRKINPFTALQNYRTNIQLKSNTEVRPISNEIYHHYQFKHSNGFESAVELYIDTKDFDKFEYVSYLIENGDSLDQLYQHFIFRKSKDNIIFEEMDRFYVEDYLKYSEAIITPLPIDKPKKIAIDDTINLDYTLIGLNRSDINLREYFKENEFLFVYTWGTWCAPCLSNIENIKKFNNEFKSNGFVTIMYEKGKATKQEMQTYLNRKKTTYPVYSNFNFVKYNNFYSFPAFAVINKNGVVVDLILGGSDEVFLYQSILDKYNK